MTPARPAAAGAPAPAGGDRLHRRALLVAAALLVLYASSLRPSGRGGDGFSALWDGWVGLSAYVAATVVLALRLRRRDAERRAWAALTLAAALFTGGALAYALDVQGRPVVPYPSYADLLWLGFYPCAYAGVVLLVRARVVGTPWSVWVDGLVGGLTAAALTVELALGPVLQATDGSLAVVATNLAYPVADLLLLVLLLGALAQLGWRPDGAWRLLVAGVLVFVVADTLYLFSLAGGSYVDGSLVDAGWPLALLALAAASTRPAPAPRQRQPTTLPALAVPGLFAVTSLLLLWWGSRGAVDPVAGVLHLGAVLLAVLRTASTFRHVSALAASRLEARTDELTGLANRRRFLEALEEASRDEAATGVVLLMDLDRFKEVNDSLGHAVGDELLVQVAVRLSDVVDGAGLLARLGGDEFAVLLPDHDVPAAERLAQTLREGLVVPFVVDDVTLHVDASTGIATLAGTQEERSGALRRADAAMYAAKERRSGVAVYSATSDPHSRGRLELLDELRAALAGDQLVLHYQPKLDLGTGRVVGVEALVRWQHPTRGLVFPDLFVPLAEQTGLMHRLTEVVLSEATRQAGAWLRRGIDLPVAVNVSPSNLLDAGLPATVAGLLASNGLTARSLEVEVTEGVLLLDRVRATQVLRELRELGVRLAVDDYGTGYSSLAYLQELPVHDLKLDRSFVMRMHEDPLAAAIVQSTVGLAHTLGLRMIAEGVENAEALEELRSYGCDLAQGYHLSRPLAAPVLEQWLVAEQGPAVVPAPRDGRTGVEVAS